MLWLVFISGHFLPCSEVFIAQEDVQWLFLIEAGQSVKVGCSRFRTMTRETSGAFGGGCFEETLGKVYSQIPPSALPPFLSPEQDKTGERSVCLDRVVLD